MGWLVFVGAEGVRFGGVIHLYTQSVCAFGPTAVVWRGVRVSLRRWALSSCGFAHLAVRV